MKRQVAFLVLSFAFLLSCRSRPALTPEETAYLQAVMDSPLTFRVPRASAEDTWGRISAWIGRYSSMKIQTASDYIIETFNPGNWGAQFGYRVNRSPLEGEMEFSITCETNSSGEEKAATRNAHILAYYARTGEVMEKFIRR
jgi:hypothetical protein